MGILPSNSENVICLLKYTNQMFIPDLHSVPFKTDVLVMRHWPHCQHSAKLAYLINNKAQTIPTTIKHLLQVSFALLTYTVSICLP